MKSLLLIVIAFIFWTGAQAQTITKQSLEKSEQQHQACLDSGTHMLQCAEDDYSEMDAALNVVYQKLYAKIPDSDKARLKTSQLKWLKMRDNEYRDAAKDAREAGLEGADVQMFARHREANYVKDRVELLLDGKW